MGTFLALDQAPAIMGTLFILDLARHLFIRQKPRFILFIMPSLGPRWRRAMAMVPVVVTKYGLWSLGRH